MLCTYSNKIAALGQKMLRQKISIIDNELYNLMKPSKMSISTREKKQIKILTLWKRKIYQKFLKSPMFIEMK